jgi:serine/threonine protein kinase
MLYEFICFKVPFGDDLTDPLKVYKQVIKDPVKFPKFLDSKMEAKSIMLKMLNRNAAARGTPKLLKAHQWLAKFEFDDMHCRKVKAPFVPHVPPTNLSLRSNRSILDILQNDEKGEKVPPIRKQPTLGWDQDF